MDAIRISDGQFVVLKQFCKDDNPHEEAVHRMMGMGELASDPRNHCIPLYEVLDVPDDPDIAILVLPLLRDFDDPQMETVGEAVEFFRQVLEVSLVTRDTNPSKDLHYHCRVCCLSTSLM